MNSPIWVQFEGNRADEGQLDLVDAAETLQGFAAVLNKVTHAFVHNNAIRNRVPVRHDFETLLTGAKKGCFELQMETKFGAAAIKNHGASVIGAKYWDYLMLSLSTATGKEFRPETPFGIDLEDQHPYIFDDIADEIETHLVAAHRPIKSGSATFARIVRPRVGEKIVLDTNTLEYIATSDKSDELQYFEGNVTRYNILTGRGRAFFENFGRTVAFKIDDVDGAGQIAHIQATESMREAAMAGIREGGKRRFGVFPIVGVRGQVKRLEAKEIRKTA